MKRIALAAAAASFLVGMGGHFAQADMVPVPQEQQKLILKAVMDALYSQERFTCYDPDNASTQQWFLTGTNIASWFWYSREDEVFRSDDGQPILLLRRTEAKDRVSGKETVTYYSITSDESNQRVIKVEKYKLRDKEVNTGTLTEPNYVTYTEYDGPREVCVLTN